MQELEATFRQAKGRIVAGLMRMLGSLEEAEDCFSAAVEKALIHWPEKPPDSPAAWLTTVARRQGLDLLRRRKRAASLSLDDPEPADEDDRLSLIFTCCHPALGWEARVALTLRTLGGLTTGEIARAFLVPETTMAQRIVRAQRKIRDAGIPYQVPCPELWGERLEGVLATVYFIFNEGYSVVRADLARQALQLGETLVELMPREAEALGLLALMLMQHSRAAARIGSEGQALTLEEQDRSLWDRSLAQRGYECLDKAMRLGRPGLYQIQAAIAAMHCLAARAEETDWTKVLALYDTLLRLDDSPVVRLNRCVALAYSGHEQEALELTEGLDLKEYAPYHRVRGELRRRLGLEWRSHFSRSLELETNPAARKTLERHLEEPQGAFGTGEHGRLAIHHSAGSDSDSHHRYTDASF